MGVRAWRWVALRAWAAVWAWAAAVSSATSGAGRPNVVKEVPGLDVGPLVGVTVARGGVARLPCRYPVVPEDTINLVLWYLNHTSRPILSYDARASLERGTVARGVGSRMVLSGGGTGLLIRNVHHRDEAEYRCQVHFRLSPTWTQRLLLRVPERVEDVVLTDGLGLPLEGRTVGPLREGGSLDLACQANHGSSEVVSLAWMLEGETVDATWAAAGKGMAINQVTLSGLRDEHRNAHLTCRLVARDPEHGHVRENITDSSIIITMYYVPEATLLVEGGRRSGGGGREVVEGRSVSFLCSVRADPPAYNITWLLNGRVVGVGARRWRRDNASLVVNPVQRQDAGLYTCLASNVEGDGHSNAVLLKVAHKPYCTGTPNKHLVVAARDNITLTCQVEAVPDALDFTWRMLSPPEITLKEEAGGGGGGGHPGYPPPIPNLNDLPKFSPATNPWKLPGSGVMGSAGEDEGEGGVLLRHRVDSASPTKSYVTLNARGPVQVLCYAKNRVGRTRVPCTYTLSVVEPPQPLQNCNITTISEALLEVKCDAHARAHAHAHAPHAPPQLSPSASFVLSPEASAKANLEVWFNDTLLANESEARPTFTVRGLPPATPLTLVLYSATPHARSTPVTLHTRTLPRSSVMPEPSNPPMSQRDTDLSTEATSMAAGGYGELGVAIGGLVGGVGVTLLVLVVVILVMKRRQKTRANLEELVSTGGDGGGGGGGGGGLDSSKDVLVGKVEEIEVLGETLELPHTPLPTPRPQPHTPRPPHTPRLPRYPQTPPPPRVLRRGSETGTVCSQESMVDLTKTPPPPGHEGLAGGRGGGTGASPKVK
ncbi:uncharacterized protein LOC126982028 [Eriocheir sinensis]|uniref:uncharacterized protein LOC126982028 n=1 Tax=Eriocheir sinensis TaxID=95602 RepID=UPI0021C720D3|nr:uncharacterized protein LOC126982028 [Eriocheir sinensis]